MSQRKPADTDVEVLDFEPSLAPFFRDLNIDWLEKYFHVEPIDHEVLNHPEKYVIEPGGTILFARVGDDVVGTVALKFHGDGVYELTKMAVTPASQGLGIGRRLLNACIDRFREVGGTRMYLESHSSLETAIRLYEGYGFEHEERPNPAAYERADVYMVFRGT